MGQEAAASFSSGNLYVEKFMQAPRHIEFQFLADHRPSAGMFYSGRKS